MIRRDRVDADGRPKLPRELACKFCWSVARSAHERFRRFDETHVRADQHDRREPMPLSLAGKAIAAVIAVGSFGAYELAPPDTRGQTVFLERLAQKIDHARVIAPETATRMSDVL